MNRRALIAAGACIVGAEVLLLLFDTGPDVWLVAALVTVVTATVAFASSLAYVTARPRRAVVGGDLPTGHSDFRTTSLRQALAIGNNDNRHADRVHAQLVAIVDDELAAVHGIDRATDPDAAGDVLGRELDRFVSDPGQAASLTPRRLARIVTLIEQL